ncbi:MAG TPA: enolase C-terminal domain-like protein [Armatimonadaceae bacterium]|nr:enolase C-terminal domain-like protein [Armatimonadaceae bacterium]
MADVPFGVLVTAAEVAFVRRPFLKPLRLASGEITEITEARATVTVETGDGRSATGHGAIYLSDLWAWPDPNLPSAERDAAMRAYCEVVAKTLPQRTGSGGAVHPLEAGLRLHATVQEDGMGGGAPMPTLARLVSTSPLDAAIHDAAGRAFGVSAFALYGQDAPAPSADVQFPEDGGAVAAVRAMLRATPAPALDATLVVGKGDDLAEMDSWVRERGYRSFKLKVGGTDPTEDAARVAAVYRHALSLGCAAPRLSVDSNCFSPDADTVARFLDVLEALDGDAYAALEAVEQPTGRDIRTHAFDWHAVAARKPLLLDEGLIDFDALRLAAEQGWNGLAVKTCRGHSFSLATAAWAHRRGWKLTVMDLTNPGISAVHSALVGAHLPGVDAIEMNAVQYTPAANADLLPRLAPLLAPADGTHRLPSPAPVGLGSAL